MYIYQQKEQQQNSQSPTWIEMEFIQNKLHCKNVEIDFSIEMKKQSQMICTLEIFSKQLPQINHVNDLQTKSKKNVEQLGKASFDLGIYIDLFKQNGKKVFKENIQISKRFTMDYELFIQKDRAKLQEHVNSVRGNSKQTDMFAKAFKKHLGKPKVRYVQLDKGQQISLKEEQFKKNKKFLISSLKKIGQIYKPDKLVKAQSNNNSIRSNRHRQHTNKDTTQDINRQQVDLQEAIEQQGVQLSNVNKSFFQRSLIQIFGNIRIISTFNQTNLYKHLSKSVVIIFWITALILLYISMSPSKKT